MRRSSLAVAVIALAACQSAPQFTEQDATAVRAVFDGVAADINKGDWTAWSTLFTEDATLQQPNGKTVHGRAALLAWGQAFPKVQHLTFSNVQVAGEGTLAWGTSNYVFAVQGAPADTGKQLVVLKKGADGSWLTAAVSFNSDIPLPAAAPSKAAPSKAPTKAPAKTKSPSKR